MNKLLLACLLALPLMAIPSYAWAGHHGCSDGDCDDGGHCWLHHGGHLASLHGHFADHVHGGHFAALHGHFAGVHGWFASIGAHEHAPSVPQAGPWYLYWPYEAHFQVPAPVPFPYYSPTLTLPANFQPVPPPPHPPVGYEPHGAPPANVPGQ